MAGSIEETSSFAKLNFDVLVFRKMIKSFKIIAIASLISSILSSLFSGIMFYVGTPPNSSDDAERYRLWMVDHQPQLMYQAAGEFYWTEIHTGMLFGGLGVLLIFVSMYFFQLLINATISKVVAKAVMSENR
jgi:hypothetical protein